MIAMPFNFNTANRYLPHIILIGLGIGTANYIMNGDLNWIQWIIQSVVTSFLVGYTLVVIASNKYWLELHLKASWRMYVTLFLVFFLVGAFASEVEQMIRSLVFHNGEYQPLSAGRMYMFNGIISLVLGFSFFQNTRFFPNENLNAENEQMNISDQKGKAEKSLESANSITKVPVKKGGNILLIPIQDIAYFEAYDNYSFLYDLKGEKSLCDYSLLFLEKRLEKKFLRVHRKYIVNSNQIKQFKPHLNGRYIILFDVPGLSPITSSKSYSTIIRKLIKIE